jgi:4a-hydroxytetrahydrobiopterin dehydratase
MNRRRAGHRSWELPVPGEQEGKRVAGLPNRRRDPRVWLQQFQCRPTHATNMGEQAMPQQDLAARQCEPCRGGVPPMDRATAEEYLVQVPGWSLKTDPERIERDFRFPDFAQAQAFAVQVGDLCEAEGHHAEIQYGWGHCTVGFWTHKIKGLHENDFVMAAKVNVIADAPQGQRMKP